MNEYKDRIPGSEPPATSRSTPAVLSLIAANVAVYALQKLTPGGLELHYALWPLQPLEGHVYFHAWQVITYAFLHSTQVESHLLFNMLGLWMFGAEVERAIGSFRFTACYFASVITAGITQLLLPPLFGNELAPTVGASGGVFGLLLAYALLFPRVKVVPLFPPIPMPAWLFATIYSLIELFTGVTGTWSGVAHFAHLGGLIGSAAVILGWRRRPVR